MTEDGTRRDLVDLATARAAVADLAIDAGTETVPLAEARGRTLAEAVTAGVDVPGFDRAAMDGYAVRAADTAGAGEASPVDLAVAGTVHAGAQPETSVGAGEAVEIATGAVLPDGADAVVVVERTTREGDVVAVREAVTPGEHVLAAGADVAAGDHTLSPGTRLTPRTIGVLSAVGADAVPVRSRPRVAVVSTGDELVPSGEDLDHGRGEVHDVNTPTVAAAVAAAGGTPLRFGGVEDDPEALTGALAEAAASADLVLTSGATSAGETDVLASLVAGRPDSEVLVHGVAVQPGKPTVVGRVDGTPYVGLPGYPVSALSVFRVLVAPALRDASGTPAAGATAAATLAVRVRHDGGRRRLLPVGLVDDGDGATLAYPVDRGSGATRSLADADGVLTVPATTNYVPAGEDVTVDLFDEDARPALLCVGARDPALASALASVERARFLARGAAAGRRWLADGVPDVAALVDSGGGVAEGDGDAPGDAATAGDVSGADADHAPGTVLGAWDREWGLAVRAADGDVDLPTVLDGEVDVVNAAPGGALREAFDGALRALADGRDVADHRVAVSGDGVAAHGLDGPARRVRDGRADAAPALRATAASLGLSFVPLGTQRVSVVAAPDRGEKSGVRSLAEALSATGLVDGLPGFERATTE